MPKIQVPEKYIRNLSQEEQIIELNNEVRCRIASSAIHGVGVFAMRDIQGGERCYCTPNVIPKFYTIPYGSLSKLLPEIRGLIIDRWASVVNGSIFQSPNDDAGLLFFINHSENENYDVVNDTATRDIKCGEEILEDYRCMKNYEKIYPWIDK